jgi:protein-disulfide isomerase
MSRPAKNAVKASPSVSAAAPARTSAPSLVWPLVLAVLAVVEVGLALYQWSELVTLRSGGQTACSISETINCETVWNSAFASRLHALTGVPVAVLGVVWGLAALVVAGALLGRARLGRPAGPQGAAVRLVAAAGFLSCITFAVASASAGALCPTCLATYALVAGYAVVAFWKLPRPVLTGGAEQGSAVAWAAVPALVAYLAVLAPAQRTPPADAQGVSALRAVESAPRPATAPATVPAQPSRPLTDAERSVASFIEGLPPVQRQALSDALAQYRATPPQPPPSTAPVRRLMGDASAPLKMVEWTDILCPHCADLAQTVKELKRVLPAGLLSIEARQFPLARDCNPMVGGNNGGEVRCAAARAQICLEPSPGYEAAREKMFAEQRSLTAARVMDIATEAGMARPALEACLADPATQAKLEQDVRYALSHRLEGTPLVVLNGRKAQAFGPLIYSLALVRGDASSPAFAGLPPPRLFTDDHAGHGH